jgi:hypothetical protein
MKPDLVIAVCELVDAVFIEHCLPVGTEGHLNEEHAVESALVLLREIRAAPEFAPRHNWTDRLLTNPNLPKLTWLDVPGGGGLW